MVWTHPKPIVFEPDEWFTKTIGKLDKLRQTEVRIKKIKGELRQAVQQLQIQKYRYQALSEISDCGIIVYRDGKIFIINKVLEEMLGYPEKELIDNVGLLSRFFSKKDLETVNERKYSNNMEPYIVTVIHKDGSKIQVRLVSKMVEYNGQGQCRAVKVIPYKERHCG
jgi:PAS domain S-box-containing protein